MNSEEGQAPAMANSGGGSDTEFKKRYIDCCRRHGVLPNRSLLSAFFKVDNKKVQRQFCRLVVFLDDLEDEDFLPLFDIFTEIDASEIDAVDIFHDSACTMDGKYILLLLRAITQNLRTVSLQDVCFGKEFLRDLSQRGLTCQTLNMRHSHFRKLNLAGTFLQLCTLNLDFSSSLSSFQEGCFTCMPNLKSLSLCETRIANLWITSSALSKLPSLVELRFQNCFCCEDTGACPTSSAGKSSDSGQVSGLHEGRRCFHNGNDHFFALQEDELDDDESQRMSEDSSDDSEIDFSNRRRESSLLEELSYAIPGWHEYVELQDEISGSAQTAPDEEGFSSSSLSIPSDPPNKYISCHPSVICYERHYRDYMIASLPRLRVLDNLPIRKIDRERASIVFAENFEYLPYRRKKKASVASLLQKREINACYSGSKSRRENQLYASVRSQCFHSRELSAARVGSSAWPLLHPLSIPGSISGDASRDFRPRQFEYHPSDPSLMAFGTLDGELVVINHENENLVSYIPSLGAMNSVLGLCWLKKYPCKIIAGSDNGSLRLYDIKHVSSKYKGNHSRSSVPFDEFDQLTSVHVNSTDEWFLASGYSKDVALYDIACGKRLQVFADMHEEHINVVKFANHSPSIFATSSFDKDVKMWDLRQKPSSPCYTASSSRGNVMVCFSPDDNYLLVSAVDNEVKQLLAADGRLHLDFNIGSTGSAQNYTRSYYLNGRDYIISGSCDEHVVRVCCAQTGRRLRDLSLEVKGTGASMFVQSLRGDPFRDFNMSILAAHVLPSSNSKIVKVNMLATSDCAKDSEDKFCHPHSIKGG